MIVEGGGGVNHRRVVFRGSIIVGKGNLFCAVSRFHESWSCKVYSIILA